MNKELTTEAPPSSSVQAPVEAKAPESPFRFTQADLDAAVAAAYEDAVRGIVDSICNAIRARAAKAPDATPKPGMFGCWATGNGPCRRPGCPTCNASKKAHREPPPAEVGFDEAAWRKSQPALFPPDATAHREPAPAESPLRDPIGGPTYDALWMVRNALEAEVASLKAYARNQGDAIAGDLRFQHKLAAELKAARAQVATCVMALREAGDATSEGSQVCRIVSAALASVGEGTCVKRYEIDDDAAKEEYPEGQWVRFEDVALLLRALRIIATAQHSSDDQADCAQKALASVGEGT